MMAGTPGFYGERLLEIREMRGLTAPQLGELIGVTKQAVSMYERAKRSPSPEMFDRLAQALRVRPRYFLRPPAPKHTGPIFYRSMAAATQQMRLRAERKMGVMREILKATCDYIDLPTISIPNISPPSDPNNISGAMIESAAALVREQWGLGEGVIGNVTLLLENKGIVASRFELESNKLDSFSLWDDYTARPLLALGQDKQSAVRSRFDAAHELAHLVLHRNVPKPALMDLATLALMEDQAHLFGRTFLLPARTFIRDFSLPTLDALQRLKPKLKVSIGLMIKRAEELDLISEEQAQRLWINRTKRGWNKREPYDDEMEPERPVLLSRSIQLLIESATRTSDDIQDWIGLFPDEIETLVGLPLGFLSQPESSVEEPEPRLLPFRGEQAE